MTPEEKSFEEKDKSPYRVYCICIYGAELSCSKYRLQQLYCVNFEVWSKLHKCICIMRIASKYMHDFDCDWQHVNAFSHCVTVIHVLLSQIISYSDTKVPLLVVVECKRATVILCVRVDIFTPYFKVNRMYCIVVLQQTLGAMCCIEL